MLKYCSPKPLLYGLSVVATSSITFAGGSDSIDHEIRRLDAQDAYLERRIDVVEDDVHSLKGGGQASYARPTHRSSYVVRTGDSLWGIARKFQVSPQTIKEVNRLSSDTIFVGQHLNIPGQSGVAVSAVTSSAPQIHKTFSQPKTTGSYTVRTGDTARSIARAHGVPLATLAQLNGLTDLNYIQVAQKLNVSAPHKQRVAAAPAPVKKAAKSQGPPPGWKPKPTIAKKKPVEQDVWAPEPLPEPLVPVIPSLPKETKVAPPVKKTLPKVQEKIAETKPAPVEKKQKKESYLSYEFQKGDSLEKVAETFGTTVSKLLEINKLPASYEAKAKDRILVPTAGVFFDVAGIR